MRVYLYSRCGTSENSTCLVFGQTSQNQNLNTFNMDFSQRLEFYKLMEQNESYFEFLDCCRGHLLSRYIVVFLLEIP